MDNTILHPATTITVLGMCTVCLERDGHTVFKQTKKNDEEAAFRGDILDVSRGTASTTTTTNYAITSARWFAHADDNHSTNFEDDGIVAHPASGNYRAPLNENPSVSSSNNVITLSGRRTITSGDLTNFSTLRLFSVGSEWDSTTARPYDFIFKWATHDPGANIAMEENDIITVTWTFTFS